jgi:DNA-binding NarL/FixJ family response regulator
MTEMAPSGINMSDSTGPAAIRVVVVGEQALLRAGLARLLEQSSDIVVVGEASDGEAAVAAIEQLHPDLVLIDLSMPRLDGSAVTRRIHDAHPDVRIIGLSPDVIGTDVPSALGADAVWYLPIDSRPEELLVGIRSALGDGSPFASRPARGVVVAWREVPEWGLLSAREVDVLMLLADGLPNKVIGQRLGVAEKTVKGHVTRVFHALGVTDRTQAALWVKRHGLSPRHQQRRDQLRAAAPPDAAGA